MVFSDCWYDDLFRRYSRSKSKVVKQCAEFWTFFSPSQILGGGPSENCTRIITPALRHVDWEKFHEDINLHWGWSVWATLNLLFVGQSSPTFFLPNVEGVVVDNGFFKLSIWRSVPKIFATKVESCKKLRRSLDIFFGFTNFRGRAFRKLYARYHPCPAARRLGKVTWGYFH